MSIRRDLHKKLLLAISLALFSVGSGGFSADASSPDQAGTGLNPSAGASPSKEFLAHLKDLKSLEDRFFFHSYDHDPPEKRVERLELLIFGGHKYGVVEDRLENLKKSIVERDQESARKTAGSNGQSQSPSQSGGGSEKLPGGGASRDESGQYPVLNTLEWRVLQKTYRSESLDQRLNRLETKLFGQPSPAMAYSDRIERLKKIVGINITSISPGAIGDPRTIPGPLPQAGRDPATGMPFRSLQELNPNSRQFQQDFHRQFNKDLSNMMRYLEGDLHKIFEGYNKNSPQGSPLIIPNTEPMLKQKPRVTVPPYADPNSI
ncbi:hypothetical protein GC174_03150 [bacterium]|nr:hypothetical protein [bacterium]